MSKPEHRDDWSAATWEGATREAMRRWAQLPLERILAAQEEMAELAVAFGDKTAHQTTDSPFPPEVEK